MTFAFQYSFENNILGDGAFIIIYICIYIYSLCTLGITYTKLSVPNISAYNMAIFSQEIIKYLH
jgi:hypothetical protein